MISSPFSIEHFANIAKVHATVRDVNESIDPSWDGLHYEWRLINDNGETVIQGDYSEFPNFNTELFNKEDRQ